MSVVLPIRRRPVTLAKTSVCGRASAPNPQAAPFDRRTSSQPCRYREIKPLYQKEIKPLYLSLWRLASVFWKIPDVFEEEVAKRNVSDARSLRLGNRRPHPVLEVEVKVTATKSGE